MINPRLSPDERLAEAPALSGGPVAAAVPSGRYTPIRRRPTYDISFTGSLYLGLIVFMYIAASNTNVSLLFGLLGLMIGTLLVSLLLTRLMLLKLEVSRELPDAAAVGRPTTIVYRFANHKRFWPSLAVSLLELDGVEGFRRQPCSYMLHAAAGASASVPVQVLPKRRGLHQLDHFQLATSFPFGFLKRAVLRQQPDVLLVFPARGRVDLKLLTLAQPAEKTGPTIRPRRGGEDEFYGLREHRRGESMRHIYWRRSARTGVLVAKEMTQVAPPRLLLLVDTFIPTPRTRSAHAQVEKGLAMAASLAEAALEQGLSVGFHAWGGPADREAPTTTAAAPNEPGVRDDGWLSLPPTRGKRQAREILALLARLPLNLTQPPQALMESAQSLLEPSTTIILFTSQNVELGLGERTRGGTVVVPVDSPAARGWFSFDPAIDFDHAFPPDQENGLSE